MKGRLLSLVAGLAVTCSSWACAPCYGAPSILDTLQDAPPVAAQPEFEAKDDIALGKSVHEEIKKEATLIESGEQYDKVNKIGQELAEIARKTKVEVLWGDKRQPKFEYHFYVIGGEEGKDVNAFSIPGGYIYVYQGLLDFIESDDELAGVLAHEIAHASLRHVATMQAKRSPLDLASFAILVAAMAGGGSGGGAELAAGASLLTQALQSGWSIDAETSADFAGLQYMVSSNYNSVGLLTFMERMAFQERLTPFQTQGIWRTHPPSQERVSFLRTKLAARGIDLERSKVAKSLRATVEILDNGGLEVKFGALPIHTFFGAEAIPRADEAVLRLNAFFDSEPELYDFEIDVEGQARGKQKRLFKVMLEDLEGANAEGIEQLREAVKQNMRRAIFDYSYRVNPARSLPTPPANPPASTSSNSGP